MSFDAEALLWKVVGRDNKKPHHGDPSREVFETVVFVVVLVLMLKLFVAEAFVIPTGSMATTLYGEQIKATCPECGHKFPVTASVQLGVRIKPVSVHCRNCGHSFEPAHPEDWNSGDRVLVAKYAYHIRPPHRFDVPVFKYPEQPYSKVELSAMNYIKRLIGLPGETIAIYNGDLYRTDKLTYPDRPRPNDPKDLWKLEYTYNANPRDATAHEARELFAQGGFEMIRKTPDEILAVRRLVFDLDEQPRSLMDRKRTRWFHAPGDDAGWEMQAAGFKHEGDALGWVRYQHVQPGWGRPDRVIQPVPIRDDMSYNIERSNSPTSGQYWAPDLIVECDAEVHSADTEITLELVKAGAHYQAIFAAGICKLVAIPPEGTGPAITLAEHAAKLSAGKKYSLSMANVDARLTVWVDGTPLPFGPAADYAVPDRKTFDHTTLDVEAPARIGAKGGVTCSKVKLWRDVYYTCSDNSSCGVQTYYVQPGHYLCLGDNSSSSSDGRTWGLVPERLLLGRAVVVYWPPSRVGMIK